MKIPNFRCLLALVFLVGSISVEAAAPVWKVEHKNNTLFVAATIHFLSASDYPLPDAFQQAYRQAHTLVFETDLEKLKTPQIQQQLLSAGSYHDGRKLNQVIKPTTYRKLEEFFANRNIPMSSFDTFKPGMVSLMMTIIELQRLNVAGIGVDEFFSNKANRDGKPSGKLESVETQIQFLSNMGTGQEDDLLLYTLADIERLPSLWQSLKAVWLSGDMDALYDLVIAPMRQDFPEVYQASLVDRNNNWMPQIESMLQSDREIEFVLVGAAHLAGEHGLLQQLNKRGYQISQLP